MRQYSCARRSWRTMSRSSGSSMRTRTIGRSPEMPCAQRADGPRRVPSQHLRRGAQRGIGVEDAVRESLEEMRLVGSMPRWCSWTCAWVQARVDGALEGRRVAVLVGEVERRLARRRDQRREGDGRRRAGREPDPAPQAEDRIEHRARGVRERAVRRSTDIGVPDAAAAAEEARAVGLVLRRRPRARLRPRRRGPPRPRLSAASAAGASRAARRASARTRSGRTGSRRPGARRRPPAARARPRRRR